MMMNLIVLDDKDVDESSKKFFKTIVTECGCLEDFTQPLELFNSYSLATILGFSSDDTDDDDIRLTVSQFNIIWENYKTINHEFKHENKYTPEWYKDNGLNVEID